MRLELLGSLLCLALNVDGLCPPGSVQGLNEDDCYIPRFLDMDAMTWQAAETFCRERDGFLASIPDAFANSFLATMPDFRAATYYWVGASSGLFTSSNNWTWVDGTAFAYTNWNSGRARATTPACLKVAATSGSWYSEPCNSLYPFVCKIPSTAAHPTSDRPAVAVCDPGWTYLAATKKCYKMLFNKPFYDALAKCSEEGGNLASMHSAVENNLLQDFAARHVNLQVAAWVGLHSPAKDCNFQWSDGTPLNYTNWYPGSPNCVASSTPYFCVTMITDVDGKAWTADKLAMIWTNYCYLNYHAICQKEPAIV